MSEGGKLSKYYSITKDGEKELKNLIKKELSNNPVQFISNAKIKLSMADLISKEEREELFLHLKTLAVSFKQEAEKILNDEYTDKNFYQRILLDNTSVQYANLVTVIEGFEKDNERNS
jgi:DNA-binding PadR family transcriptional regulator